MKKYLCFFLLLLSSCSMKTAQGITPILVPAGTQTKYRQESSPIGSTTHTSTNTDTPATFTSDFPTIAVPPPSKTRTPPPPVRHGLGPMDRVFLKRIYLFGRFLGKYHGDPGTS
jgi:hypothetical protein